MTHNRLSEKGPNGKTMGQEWKEICAKYPSLGPSPSPSPGKPYTKAGDDAYYHPGVQDDGHGFLACCPDLEIYQPVLLLGYRKSHLYKNSYFLFTVLY